jgi:hypothetical protein
MRAHVSARAEYRPVADTSLVITVDVPEHVLDVAGGFAELTETVEYHQAANE